MGWFSNKNTECSYKIPDECQGLSPFERVEKIAQALESNDLFNLKALFGNSAAECWPIGFNIRSASCYVSHYIANLSPAVMNGFGKSLNHDCFHMRGYYNTIKRGKINTESSELSKQLKDIQDRLQKIDSKQSTLSSEVCDGLTALERAEKITLGLRSNDLLGIKVLISETNPKCWPNKFGKESIIKQGLFDATARNKKAIAEFFMMKCKGIPYPHPSHECNKISTQAEKFLDEFATDTVSIDTVHDFA